MARLNLQFILECAQELAKENVSDRASVIVAYAFIEVAARELLLATTKGRLAKHRDAPFGVRVAVLNELDEISDDLYEVLLRFKRIRDEAGHDPKWKLNQDVFTFFKEKGCNFPQGRETGQTLGLAVWGRLINERADVFSPMLH